MRARLRRGQTTLMREICRVMVVSLLHLERSSLHIQYRAHECSQHSWAQSRSCSPLAQVRPFWLGTVDLLSASSSALCLSHSSAIERGMTRRVPNRAYFGPFPSRHSFQSSDRLNPPT